MHRLMFFIGLLVSAFATATLAAPEGRVAFFKIAATSFNPYSFNPTPAEQAWMQAHYTRLKVWSPYFDSRLWWFPNAWFNKNAYAIRPNSDVFADHPEWVLRDENDNLLHIPWGCGGGTCPQYAGDFGNPEFRAWWIAEAQATAAQGYPGVWIDDVNMTWRVSDGNADFVNPIDPRTGQLMTLANWRRYMAEFMEDVRAALPELEIAHNIIWYATDRDNTNPYMIRQVEAADYMNLERGITDLGLTGNDGRFGLTTFLSYLDFIHYHGVDVVLMDEAVTTVQRQYALAGWLLINRGNDLMSTENSNWSTPDNFWPGYNVDLGAAQGPRYDWQTLIRRDFECGIVLLNPPDRPTVSVSFGQTYTTIEGNAVSSANVAGDHSRVLLDDCASIDRDADDDGVLDLLDNCIETTNGNQRDSNDDGFGNRCDADLNNDCIVNSQDLGALKAVFFSANADADFNGDGVVNTIDIGVMKGQYFDAPGPSGVADACGQ